MVCARCGEANASGAKFCVQCGAEMPAEPQVGAGTLAGSPSVLGLGMTRPAPAAPVRPPGPPPETSGKAIAALICGLFFWIFPAAVGAIILGHLSLSQIRGAAGRLKGRGMAITGLVLGYSGVFFIPVVLIVAAIAIPNLLRARMAANEASAVGALRTINTATITYAATYNNGFAPDLATLAGAASGPANCDRAQLIDPTLASGQRHGYVFQYNLQVLDLRDGRSLVSPPRPGCATPGSSAYEVTADPAVRGETGFRSFFTNETGVIRQSQNGIATATSSPIE
jgi:type IV pilus assembly protein PilA